MLYITCRPLPFLEKKFPELECNVEIFGKNLAVEYFGESIIIIIIGDVFEVGTAIIEVSEAEDLVYFIRSF